MKKIWIIAKRELDAYFDSLMAYIMIVLFLGFSGFFTWINVSNVFFNKVASLQIFFSVAYWTLFFFIPALTMRLLAEENRSGTIELLLSKPVNDFQVVLGKFLSVLILILVSLGLSLPYYFTVSSLGQIDHGAVWTGYLALILMSAAYCSIGVFTSSISNNQIVGFLLALFIGIFFHIIFGSLADSFNGITARVFDYLSASTHFESMSRGVIDSRDIIYFLSIILLGLTASEMVLSKRNVSR